MADAATVAVGSQVTYTVTATNAGPSRATGVIVTDEIPAGMAVVSAPAGCAVVGTTVTCTAGDLDPGTTATYAIVLEAPAGIAAGSVTNTATATSATPDPDTTNNQQSATVEVVILSDVAITKTLLTDPIVAGQPVTYEISVTNNGPNDAPDVVLSDTLPPGTTLEAFTPPRAGRATWSPRTASPSSAARSTSWPSARH